MSRFVPEPPPASVNATNARASLSPPPAIPTASPSNSNATKVIGSRSTHPLSTPHGGSAGETAGRIRSSSHEEEKDHSESETSAVVQDDIGRGGRGGKGMAAAETKGRETGGRVGGAEWGLTTNLGTVAWAAPEMLLAGESGRGEYTYKVRGWGWVTDTLGRRGGGAACDKRPTSSGKKVHRISCPAVFAALPESLC